MMQIGVMRMPVHQRGVPVPMAVRLARGVGRRMPMPVVFVVGVPVLMLDRCVRMLVLMTLAQVQPQTDCHQAARRDQPRGQRFVEQGQRKQHANERGR